MTTKEEKKIRRVRRRALLHIKIVNARSRKIPGKVAWIAALCAAIGAGIYSHSYGGLVAGAAIVMFLICSVMFHILSRIVFGIIGLITARAYNRQRGGSDRRYHAEWDHVWDDEDDWQSYRYNDASNQGTANDSTDYKETYDDSTYENNKYYNDNQGYSDRSQYRQQYENNYSNAGRWNAGMSVEQAMEIFGVNPGTFSSSELKEKWREMIKKNHPDQNVEYSNSDIYEEKTKQINIAYEILKGYACDA